MYWRGHILLAIPSLVSFQIVIFNTSPTLFLLCRLQRSPFKNTRGFRSIVSALQNSWPWYSGSVFVTARRTSSLILLPTSACYIFLDPNSSSWRCDIFFIHPVTELPWCKAMMLFIFFYFIFFDFSIYFFSSSFLYFFISFCNWIAGPSISASKHLLMNKF